MLNDEHFNKAKYNQIQEKVFELDKILARNLPANNSAVEARKRLIECLMYADHSLLKDYLPCST